jgi:hypothetical protein
MVEVPSAPGIVAFSVPAAGGGGAVVSRLEKRTMNGATRVLPERSRIAWATVKV